MNKIFNKLILKKSDSKEKGDPILLAMHRKFINLLLRNIKLKWDTIEIDFEYYPYPESYSKKGNFEIYVMRIFNGKKFETGHNLTLEALDALIEINAEMSKNNSEPWPRAVFTLDKNGKYNFDFQYGIPPKVKERLSHSYTTLT